MDSAAPRRTTWWAGTGFALVGLIQLIRFVGDWSPALGGAFEPLRSAPVQLVVMVLTLLACVVAAFGFPRERDLVGSSAVGRTALLVLGVSPVILGAFSFVASSRLTDDGSSAPLAAAGTILSFLPAVAILIAGIAVARAGVLAGPARWSLLAVGAAQVVWIALSQLPGMPDAYYLVVNVALGAVPTILLLAAGVSVMVSGRSAAIAARARAIYAAW